MKAGFDASEAKDLLAMTFTAGILGPQPSGISQTQLPPAKQRDNPIPDDNGTEHPYWYPQAPYRVWPVGWGAPEPASASDPWPDYLATSHVEGVVVDDKRFKVNNAIIAFNPSDVDGDRTYAIGFAGTENKGGILEDVTMTMVSAGAINVAVVHQRPFHKKVTEHYESHATYVMPLVHQTDPCTESGGTIKDPVPQPLAVPNVDPMVHLGFRVGFESLAGINGSVTNSLETILTDLAQHEKSKGHSRMNVLVTGHSLGGPLASLCAAWLAAGNLQFDGIEIAVKCYTFASPKVGNEAFAAAFGSAITNHGFAFRVVNTLDTVPQIPPTLESALDLNNPAMADTLFDAVQSPFLAMPKQFKDALEAIKKAAENPTAGPCNFTHVGSPVFLPGIAPVVFECENYPPHYYAPHSVHAYAPGKSKSEKKKAVSKREWWQHWPCNYARLLDLYFPG